LRFEGPGEHRSRAGVVRVMAEQPAHYPLGRLPVARRRVHLRLREYSLTVVGGGRDELAVNCVGRGTIAEARVDSCDPELLDALARRADFSERTLVKWFCDCVFPDRAIGFTEQIMQLGVGLRCAFIRAGEV